MTTPTDTPPTSSYHGTRADLKPGDLIEAGYSSNYGKRKQASWVYLTGKLDTAPRSKRRPSAGLRRTAMRQTSAR